MHPARLLPKLKEEVVEVVMMVGRSQRVT